MLAIYISLYFPDMLAVGTPECIPVMLALNRLSYLYRIQVGSQRRTILRWIRMYATNMNFYFLFIGPGRMVE